MLKLKSENLPICEKELQQRSPPKPPENTPVFAFFFFFFLQRKDDWKLFNYRKWDKDNLIDFFEKKKILRNSFISSVMRKPKPTRGLNLETNKSWNSCFTAISELRRRKQFDIDFSFQERNKRDK